MYTFDNIVYTEENDVSWIKLNRPNKLNALTKQMWQELYESLELAKDSSTQVIVLNGIGRAFSAGDDIQSMHDFKNKDEAIDFFTVLLKLIKFLLHLEKPTIAMVNGLAYGGGCEILLCTDVNIASNNSTFALPESKLGLIPPVALSIGYDLLGIKQLKRMALTGEAIDAYKAQNIGIVDYIVDENDLKSKTLEIVSMILANAPDSIKSLKRLSYQRINITQINKAIEELIELSIKEESKKLMDSFIKRT